MFSFFGANAQSTVLAEYSEITVDKEQVYSDQTDNDHQGHHAPVDDFEIEESENGNEKNTETEKDWYGQEPAHSPIGQIHVPSALSQLKYKLYRQKSVDLFVLHHSWKSHLS